MSSTLDPSGKQEILMALEMGATTKALSLALSALGRDDSVFMGKAAQHMRPASTDEAWRMAYRTYSRYRERIPSVVSGMAEDAVELFAAASQECSEIYNIGGNMAHELACAVCEALSKEYNTAVDAQNAL